MFNRNKTDLNPGENKKINYEEKKKAIISTNKK